MSNTFTPPFSSLRMEITSIESERCCEIYFIANLAKKKSISITPGQSVRQQGMIIKQPTFYFRSKLSRALANLLKTHKCSAILLQALFPLACLFLQKYLFSIIEIEKEKKFLAYKKFTFLLLPTLNLLLHVLLLWGFQPLSGIVYIEIEPFSPLKE